MIGEVFLLYDNYFFIVKDILKNGKIIGNIYHKNDVNLDFVGITSKTIDELKAERMLTKLEKELM